MKACIIQWCVALPKPGHDHCPIHEKDRFYAPRGAREPRRHTIPKVLPVNFGLPTDARPKKEKRPRGKSKD